MDNEDQAGDAQGKTDASAGAGSAGSAGSADFKKGAGSGNSGDGSAGSAGSADSGKTLKTSAELFTAEDAALAAYQADMSKPELKKAWEDARKAAKDALANEIKTGKAPDKYDLKPPEKSLLTPKRIEEIAAFAKEHGFSNDKAQALVNRENQLIADERTLILKEGDAKMAEMRTGWIATAKEDKEIGGADFVKNTELARRVIARFGTPEFAATLSDKAQGEFGNHPELLRMLTRIGKAMSDDQLVVPGAQGGKDGRSFADKFYGAK